MSPSALLDQRKLRANSVATSTPTKSRPQDEPDDGDDSGSNHSAENLLGPLRQMYYAHHADVESQKSKSKEKRRYGCLDPLLWRLLRLTLVGVAACLAAFVPGLTKIISLIGCLSAGMLGELLPAHSERSLRQPR